MKKTELFHKENQRRLLALDGCLRSGGSLGWTKEWIISKLQAQGFEISKRTFNRDIEKLRELDAPVAYDYKADAEGTIEVRWSYTDPSWTMSDIPMTEGTLFALLISQRVMQQFVGLPVAKELQNAFNTIADSFNRKVAVQHNSLVPISFSPEKAAPVIPQVWEEVAEATMKHRRLQITYCNRWNNNENTATKRTVVPCHIVNLQGAWYLLATASLTDNSLRQYALSRITAAKALPHNANPPEGFDINRILASTFGQFIGDPDNLEEIHLRFTQRVAPLVNARQYSGEEKRKTLPNGDLELRFPASPAGPWPHYHIKSWVLSWGADVKVLGPESLITEVREEIQRMAAE